MNKPTEAEWKRKWPCVKGKTRAGTSMCTNHCTARTGGALFGGLLVCLICLFFPKF